MGIIIYNANAAEGIIRFSDMGRKFSCSTEEYNVQTYLYTRYNIHILYTIQKR